MLSIPWDMSAPGGDEVAPRIDSRQTEACRVPDRRGEAGRIGVHGCPRCGSQNVVVFFQPVFP
jgi:hypothetical protein